MQTSVCRDVQLALYGAVSAVDAERRRADGLLHENGVLTRELARIQQRQTRWHAERQVEQAEIVAARLEMIRLQAELASRERATASVAHHGANDAASERRAAAEERAAWQASVAGCAQKLQPSVNRCRIAAAAATSVEAPADAVPAAGSLLDAVGEARRILCVGGRTGHVPIYRALVEEHGGRFLHHDGGIEDNVRRLDAQLSAADLVICQTGCLSHNAYWRVKDHCKRTGTPCVYLDKPGTGSFLRGLVAGAAKTDATLMSAEVPDRTDD